ncbi:APC family permease [Metamycoplasma sualvi]|uniref:APC family permease n=1 Tax=Metamycoplasma sualvi TaxID=2125 RepID=UPI00387392F4
MAKKEKKEGISQASKSKKISFFSAILVVMGSSIGAGIFFKSKSVLDNSQNSLILAIFCWIIAAFSVIAMALALIEISSARNDNLSVLGWTKVFNSRTTFKASKNFMFYIYLPLTYFFMPLYVIMSLQDGIGALVNADMSAYNFGTPVDWLIWTIISIAISVYFIYVSGISSKVGNIQNKIVTYIKFLPLAFVAIMGFVLVGMKAGGWNEVSIGVQKPTADLAAGGSLSSFAPGLGMFLAISAIFFAYDGFYVAAGIQSEMEEPKKTPMAILLGLVFTTVIYLIIAISMSINGGSFSNMLIYMIDVMQDTGRILFGIINIMIAIGVLGIINGFAMWAPRFTEDLIKEGELPFSIKYKDKLNENKPKIGIMYSFVITIPIVIVFTLIGALAYIDNYGTSYGSGMGKLYTFADLMGTWTALFTFGFITAAIYGGIKNRKTKKVQTDQKSYFVPMAIVAVIIVGLALTVTILIPILDLLLIAQLDQAAVEAPEVEGVFVDIIVSRVMLVITLIIFIALSYGTTLIEDRINIKKFGSIEKYEAWQKQNFIVS